MEEPTELVCPRCGYCTPQRSNMKKHLLKPLPCTPKNSDMTVDEIRNQFPWLFQKQFKGGPKSLFCSICKKGFNSKQGLQLHEKKYCNGPMKNISNRENLDAKIDDVIAKSQEIEKEIAKLNDNFLQDKAILIEERDGYIDENTYLKSQIVNLENKVLNLEIALQIEKKNVSEKTYQKLLERFRFPGSTHMRLSCGISDITTDTVHAEIKRYDTWKEAVGQLLSFNIASPRAELHVYLFGRYSISCKKIAIEHLQKLNIKPFEIKFEDDIFTIRDVLLNTEQQFKVDADKLLSEPTTESLDFAFVNDQ